MSSQDNSELYVNVVGLGNIVDGFIDYVHEKHDIEIDKVELLEQLKIKSVSKPPKATKTKAADKPERTKCERIIVKTGNQCVKMAAPDSKYCNIHNNQKKEIPSVKPVAAKAKPTAAKVVNVKKQTSATEDARKEEIKKKMTAVNSPDKEIKVYVEKNVPEEEIEDVDLTEDDQAPIPEKEYPIEPPKKTINILNKTSTGPLSGKLKLSLKK